MKKALLSFFLVVTVVTVSNAQADLAPDQNPNYAVSRDKYMKMADSVNSWHSTTLQNTYKAIDWMADRQEARDERIAFRRQLRLNRAQWNNRYSNYYGYNDPYYNNYNNNYNYRWRRPGFWWW